MTLEEEEDLFVSIVQCQLRNEHGLDFSKTQLKEELANIGHDSDYLRASKSNWKYRDEVLIPMLKGRLCA